MLRLLAILTVLLSTFSVFAGPATLTCVDDELRRDGNYKELDFVKDSNGTYSLFITTKPGGYVRDVIPLNHEKVATNMECHFVPSRSEIFRCDSDTKNRDNVGAITTQVLTHESIEVGQTDADNTVTNWTSQEFDIMASGFSDPKFKAMTNIKIFGTGAKTFGQWKISMPVGSCK